MAGVHATFLAEAIVQGTGMASYHERRNAHGLGPYHETVRYAADLRWLEE